MALDETITIRSRLRDRTARRQVCRRLFSAGFRRGLRLLQAASGIRGKGRRLLRRASWRRQAKAGGFRGGGRLLGDERGSAQNRAFLAARASWEQVNSRDRPVSSEFIFDSAHKSKWSGRL